MAVNFSTHGAALDAAYSSVVDPNSSTDWALFGYDKATNDLMVVSTGDGGLEELEEEFSTSKMLYAFAKVIEPDSKLPKYVFISWCGDGVPVARKGLLTTHIADVRARFTGFHRTEMDVDPDLIRKRVRDSAGSKYSHQQKDLRLRKDIHDSGPDHSSIGTNYERPQIIAASKTPAYQEPVGTNYQRPEIIRASNMNFKPESTVGTNYQRPEIIAASKQSMEDPQGPGTSYQRPEIVRPSKLPVNVFEAKSSVPEPTRPVPSRAPALPKPSSEVLNQVLDTSEEERRERAFRQQQAEQERLRKQAEEAERKMREEKERKERMKKEQEERERENERLEKGRQEDQRRREEEARKEQERQREERKKLEQKQEEEERKRFEEQRRIEEQRQIEERKRREEEERKRQEEFERQEQERRQQEELAQADQLADRFQQSVTVSNKPTATALYDYEPNEENELALHEGDIVTDIDQIDDGWWFGCVGGRSGIFPANYVMLHPVANNDADSAPVSEPVQEQPPAQSSNGLTVRALYEYAAAEENELSFCEGTIICNVEQVSEDWWAGTTQDGHYGLFPANYVETL